MYQNPICIYHFHDKGFYLYASTEDILNKSISRLGIEKLNHDRISVDIGDILRVDSNGNIQKERFETVETYPSRSSGYYQYYMYDFDDDRTTPSEEARYIMTLKQMSGLYGYTPDDVEELLAMGWTANDIELLFYEGDIYGDEEDEICFERAVLSKSK